MKSYLFFILIFFAFISCKTEQKHDDGQSLMREVSNVSQAVEQVGNDFSDTSCIYYIEEAQNFAGIRKSQMLKNTVMNSKNAVGKQNVEEYFDDLKTDIIVYCDAAIQYAEEASTMFAEKDVTERQLLFQQLERNLDKLRAMPENIEYSRQRILRLRLEEKH